MNDPLPRAYILPSKRPSIKIHRSKYVTKVFDEILYDLSANQFAIPDRTIDYETTSFNCALSLLTEVDLAVYINVSKIVASFTGGCVSRRLLHEGLSMHTISKEKKHYHVFCIQPSDQFCNEYELLESTMFSNLTSNLVEFAVDLGLTKFAITDYVHWIFFVLKILDGKIVLIVKTVRQESRDPTVRSTLLIQLMFGNNNTRIQEDLILRRELGRFVESMKVPESSFYPPFEFGPLPMSRQKPMVEVQLVKDKKNANGLIDLLHDDVDIMYLQQYNESSYLVSIDGIKMILKTFESVQTWLNVLDVYTKWLAPLQGRTIPYLYSAVTSDPFRGNCRRQLGLLLEHIEGVPLSIWLRDPFHPGYFSLAEAQQLVRTNCIVTLQKVHSYNVANGSIENTFVVNSLDLTVSMVDWDLAKFGGNLQQDIKMLKQLWIKYSN